MVSFNQPRQFLAEEINLGEQAAGLVAISIAKAKLYDAESQRSAQLTALQSISQMVVSSLDLDKIFATVVNVLHDTFKYPYVSIYRLHGEPSAWERKSVTLQSWYTTRSRSISA